MKRILSIFSLLLVPTVLLLLLAGCSSTDGVAQPATDVGGDFEVGDRDSDGDSDGGGDSDSYSDDDAGEDGGGQAQPDTGDVMISDAEDDGTIDPCDDVDCSGLDTQCATGKCNPETGACEAAAANHGEACDDGDLCTQSSTCDGGTCLAGSTIDCSGEDGQCAVGTCNAETGACEAVPGNHGEACDDGDLCTEGSTCDDGTCLAGSPVDCSSEAGQCATATCDPDTGNCVAQPANDGAACEDGNLCTEGSTCDDGTCLTGSTIDCSSEDSQCAVGTCDPETGNCIAAAANAGLECEDGSLCSVSTCVAGQCEIDIKNLCALEIPTCTVGICDADNGACGLATAPDTASCELIPDFCVSDGALDPQCTNGVCSARRSADCNQWAVRTYEADSTEWFGPEEGSLNDRICPEGMLLSGARAHFSSRSGFTQNLVRFAFRCTAYAIDLMDDDWTVELGDSTWLADSGSIEFDDNPLMESVCPEGQVAIGFRASVAANYVSGFQAECSSIEVKNVLRIRPVGPTAPAPWLGEEDPAAELFSCPEGTLSAAARVRDGSVMNGFQFHCRDSRLHYTTTQEQAGSSTGEVRRFDCPEGSLLVGLSGTTVSGFYNHTLSRFAALCAPITLDDSGAEALAVVGNFEVTPAMRLGTIGGTPVNTICPDGQAIWKIQVAEGGTDGRPNLVVAQCGIVKFDEVIGVGYTLRIEDSGATRSLGRTVTTTKTMECPEGLILSSLWARTDEVVDALAARCTPPVIYRP